MVLQVYGDIDKFMSLYNPVEQRRVCKDVDSCFTGDYPTLNSVKLAFGRTAGIQWLIPQILNLTEFCGCKEKLDSMQIEELSVNLESNYSYYKISEFMLFFWEFKSGKYGIFYGSVDPLVITTSIRKFDSERSFIISKKESEKENQRLESERVSAISFAEYAKRITELNNDGKVEFCRHAMEEAVSIVNNRYKAGCGLLSVFDSLFKNKYHVTAKEYIDMFSPPP